MTKVALIIETRKHKALPFVLKSVMNKLSEDWKLQIFHGTDNIDYIKSITGNELNDRTILTNLNFSTLPQWPESNELMVSETFWNQCEGDTILYFEADSMACSNSEYKITDFEHFDYIGGYWGNTIYGLDEEYPAVMNGGFSLRKKKYLLDCIKYKRSDYLKNGGNECEDYFFSACLDKKPLTKEVLSFSIDNGYVGPINGVPFGLHKPWGEIPAKGHGRGYNEIREVCEDVEILKELQVIIDV